MMKRQHMIACGGSLLMGLTGVANAESAPSNADLQAEIAQLKTEIAQMRGAQDDVWMNERRTEQMKALINDVLADADTRASLLEGGMTAGHNGNHFFLSSEDGGFLMNISGQLQIRHVTNFRDGGDPDDVDDQESGFEVRRAKLGFSGHIADPRIMYKVRLAVDRADNSVDADILKVGYKFTDTITVWAGEDKAPFLREETTSSANQLAVERSLMNEVFTAGYIQGIWMTWDAHDMVKVAVAITDGARSGEDNGTDDGIKRFYADNSDFALTGRVDVRLAGDWAQMNDFSAWSGEELGAFIGAAGHYEVIDTQPGGGTAARTVDDIFSWTIDASVEYMGFNAYAAGVGFHANADAGDADIYGFVVQGGYMVLPDKLEPFVRYEYFEGDGISDTSLVTFGVNYYLNKHDAKFQLDFVWALDSIDEDEVAVPFATTGLSGLGLLHDDPDQEDQFAIRAQFQLLF